MSNQDLADLTEYGMVALRVPPEGPPAADAALTIIISGVNKAATRIVAALFSVLGIPMSKSLDTSVLEDKEFVGGLMCFDWRFIRALVTKRNDEVLRWGFQFPLLQDYLFPVQLECFRNPYLVIVDGGRNFSSFFSKSAEPEREPEVEPQGEPEAHESKDILEARQDIIRFVQRASVPALLLNYNQFLVSPDKIIDGITKFCGIEVSQTTRASALIATSGIKQDLFYFPISMAREGFGQLTY